MCRRTTCKQCGKPNWAGCGAHVEMVLADVPKSERCRCREVSRQPKPQGASKTGSKVTQPVADGALGRFKAWLRQ